MEDILHHSIIKYSFEKDEYIILEKGFFILLIMNGTASLDNAVQQYKIKKNDLIILTPSMTHKLHEKSHDFSKLPILGYPLLDGRQSAPV